jgi:hypothetical protein
MVISGTEYARKHVERMKLKVPSRRKLLHFA